jgi:hypothetical protein
MNSNQSVDPRLWRATLGLLTLALTGALALIVGLTLGWNSPAPTRPPDWRASGLPLSLDASSDGTAVRLLGYSADDFTLEIQAVPRSGPDFNGYGLIYRARDPAHYYAFAVGGDGYYAVLRVTEGRIVPLVDWRQFPHVRRGREPNRLRVACAGPTCRFYINDEYATAVGDDAWPAGEVGLWVRAFEDERVAVEFVHARVWR